MLQALRCVFASWRAVLPPLFLLGGATLALAGVGPENVLLVVNPRSQASLTIANHYARLRQIPADNVLYLAWDTKAQTTDVDTFRQQILLPVLQAIQNRHVDNQTDCVVYSSDFPWGISLDGDVRKFVDMLPPPKPQGDKADDPSASNAPAEKPTWPKHLTPTGSLTGLTYYWQPMVARHPAYFELRGNYYMRQPAVEHGDVPSEGFRGNRQYDAQGKVVAAGGRRYFLSVMLGVTAGRGNSLAEVLGYLKRSAAADGTRPKGTIYYMRTDDVRSKARQVGFAAAVEELKKQGVAAEILDAVIPRNKNDVQGTMMGTAAFDWKTSGSTIRPGAICEHFTSFGGAMNEGAGQTPLSEFLRYGAAGACGTVIEPYAIAEKFPSPMIQVHYARGCTLAEAFYQSVHGPYQLLIVGDPLCRPWADIPRISASGVEAGAVVRGSLTITPAATLANGAAVDRFELFVDAIRVAECKPGGAFTLDSAPFADGHHELRIVGIGPQPIESQGWKRIPVRLANHGRTIEASVVAQGPLRADKPVTLAARAPGSVGIVVLQGSRIVGRIGADGGPIEIPPDTLGSGPVQLRVVGLGNGGPTTNVVAEPLELVIE